MANKAKITYMIECQTNIAQDLEWSLKVLREKADREMLYTQLSTHSPYYEKAIGHLSTALKLTQARIDILNRALAKE